MRSYYYILYQLAVPLTATGTRLEPLTRCVVRIVKPFVIEYCTGVPFFLLPGAGREKWRTVLHMNSRRRQCNEHARIAGGKKQEQSGLGATNGGTIEWPIQ